MSESERRYPQSHRIKSRSARRRRQIQKRKRVASLFLHAVMVMLLACIAFYIGTKVTGQTEKSSGQTVNSSLSGDGTSANSSVGASSSDEGSSISQSISDCTVVVDPGHGGSQPGAVVTTSSGEIYEKDINLAIALFLETMLTDAGCDVILTRDTDVYVSLETRAEICNGSDADFFVSIHQNILEDDAVTNGVETWYWNGSAKGLSLATCLQNAIVEATGAKSLGVKDTTELYVLHYTNIPSALIESGFLSCADELENLLNSAYQEKIAEGIYEGILEYIEDQ